MSLWFDWQAAQKGALLKVVRRRSFRGDAARAEIRGARHEERGMMHLDGRRIYGSRSRRAWRDQQRECLRSRHNGSSMHSVGSEMRVAEAVGVRWASGRRNRRWVLFGVEMDPCCSCQPGHKCHSHQHHQLHVGISSFNLPSSHPPSLWIPSAQT